MTDLTTHVLRNPEDPTSVRICVIDGDVRFERNVNLAHPHFINLRDTVESIAERVESKARKLHEQVALRKERGERALKQEVTLDYLGTQIPIKVLQLDEQSIRYTYTWYGQTSEGSCRFTHPTLHLTYLGAKGLSSAGVRRIKELVRYDIDIARDRRTVRVDLIEAYVATLPSETDITLPTYHGWFQQGVAGVRGLIPP